MGEVLVGGARLRALVIAGVLAALAWTGPAAAEVTGVGSEAPVGANGTGETACNTAGGDGTPGGESLSGLARAFFYAGARALLVSHWPVASGPTVELTTTMFEIQARDPGLGKAEALRRSQAALRARPETAHPFFWAPFVLAGDGGAGP